MALTVRSSVVIVNANLISARARSCRVIQKMKRVIRNVGITVACFLCAITFTSRANAFGYIYHFNIGGDQDNFSGTQPSSPPPWVDMYFQDAGAGAVSLTISNVGLTATEKLTQLYVNLNPTLDPTSLIFTPVSSTAGVFVPTLANGAITEGVNAFKADGDGKYDVLLNFSTTPGDSFNGGEYVSYLITGITGLNAMDFYRFLSLPAGGHGPFFAAAHIQSISYGEGSGWIAPSDSPSGVEEITVPEPASASLLLLAGAVGALRYRASRKA